LVITGGEPLSDIRDVRGPELLAPAGDWDSLRAAVANGADAVYFGLPRFNARQRAANFTLEELGEVIRYVHDRNVRGYVAFNTLIFPDELPQAVEYILAIAAAGADAVIVQDLGLARLIHRMAPDLPIHASTQMTQTEPRGIELLRALGVRRVILAREVSLREIGGIARASNMELEVFVHGALCVSYSGQCLASEALWARSANRGLCAQACRLPYRLVVDGRQADLGDRTYLLSMPDLAAWDRVRELAALGVAGLKIEGRLKSAEYVAAAVRVYRAAIDAAAQGRAFALPPEQESQLAQSFSRGFTHGYLDGVNHQEVVHGLFARHLGVRVGVVAGATRRGVLVEPDCPAGAPLKPGDGVVFDDGRLQQDQQGGRVYAADPYAGSGARPAKGGASARKGGAGLVEIRFRAGEVDAATIPPGSIVWRTDDPGLRRELKKTYSRDQIARRVPLSVRVWAGAGENLRVAARDGDGNEAGASWDSPLLPAGKHPLTTDLLREQFCRLGQTPYELAAVELMGPAGATESVGVLAPKSVLNDLRRRIVDELMKLREARTRYGIAEPDALDNARREALPTPACPPDGRQVGRCQRQAGEQKADAASLHVLVRAPDQLHAVLDWRAADSSFRPATVYCDFEAPSLNEDAVASCRRAGVPVALATLRILKPGEEDMLREIADCRPDAVLVRNLGAMSFLREVSPQLPLVGDHSLNVANEIAAALLVEAGLRRVVPSCDLDFAQLSALLSRIPPAVFEVVVHQHVPMFHMEHCVFAACLSRGRDRRTCGRPCGGRRVELRDRIGEDHPVLADAGCRNTVFNSHAQSAAQFVPRLIEGGVRHFRVELLRESPGEAGALLECYAGLIAGADDGATAWRRLGKLCRSRLTRGTLERRGSNQ
jgi:putative protease